MRGPTIVRTTHQATDDTPASVESVLSGSADTLVTVNGTVLDGPRLEGVLEQIAAEYAETLKGLAFTVNALGDPDPVQLAAWLGEHIAHLSSSRSRTEHGNPLPRWVHPGRVAAAISAAEEAFWHAVATAFPECPHGDEPGDLDEFDRVLDRAVSDWLVCNWPPEPLAAARVRVERELRAAGWDTVADEVAAGVAFHTLLKRLIDLGLGQSDAAYIVADAAHNLAGTED